MQEGACVVKRLLVVALFVVLCIYMSFGLFRYYLKKKLVDYLTVTAEPACFHYDALYMLGGSTLSTYHHMLKAAELYKHGYIHKILIFKNSDRGPLDPVLHKNLSVNEWLIRHFKKNGVPDSAVTVIHINERFFGTLSEARDVAVYSKNEQYRSIILLSSPCHSRRVALSFGTYLENSSINFLCVGSKDTFSGQELVLEFLKVQVYKFIIKWNSIFCDEFN